ncbi:hypothetical protein GGF37_001543 [Kickxella alabastrina]|nr:hypothetical protein GGF37_001543 [Kickxella alabastrina]
MASNSDRNSGGAMHDSGYGQQQFRRTTGKVAANGGAYQSQQHPQQQQQQPPMYYAPMQATYANQQQYQAPYPLGVVSAQQYGQLNSAIPAPHDFKLQNPALAAHLQYANQRPQQQMMMGAPVAGYAQRPMAPSVYYTMVQPPNMQNMRPINGQPYAPQQQRNGAGPGGYTDDSSDSLDLYSQHRRDQHKQREQRQQNQSSSTDSAVHNNLYTNTPSDSTEAANATVSASMLADDFERMGMGSRPTTAGGPGTNGHSGANKMLSNAQRQTIPVPRRREQDLEDEYDNDDGSAGGDIDASLFPSNPSQMAHMGRSEKYGSAAPAANNARTNTSSSQMSLGKTSTTPTFTPTSTPISTTDHATPIHSTNARERKEFVPLLMQHPHFTKSTSHTQNTAIPQPAKQSNRRRRTTISILHAPSAKQPDDVMSPLPALTKSKSLYKPHHPKNNDNDADGSEDTLPALPPVFSSLSLLGRRRHRRLLREESCMPSLTTGGADSNSPQTRSRFLRRRHLSNASMYSLRSSCGNLLPCSGSTSPQAMALSAVHSLTPLTPHWSRCKNKFTRTPVVTNTTTTIVTTTTTQTRTPTLDATENPKLVALNPTLVSGPTAGNTMRAPASRNASPHNSMIPAEIAGLQRGFGTQSSSTTGTNSPAPNGRPYMREDGFDLSSNRLDSSARPVQQLQQQGQQQFQHPPHSGFHTDPRDRNMVPRNGPPFGQAHPGQPGLGPIQGPGPGPGMVIGMNSPYNSSNSNTAIASNYSRSGSGEAAGLPEPGMLPQAGMQPWNGSNKSLPGAVGLSQLAGRNAPGSGSNSTMGAAPMTAAPSARNAPMSSPAQAPPPTVSSLEAYRVSIKRSSDPAAQLEFAKYVLEHARGLADQEQTAELQQKRYSTLTAEGLKWIKKLAGSGITVHRSNIAAEAQFFLGTMYSQGIYGVKRDDARAFSYYQQASKAQHAEANYRTAVCYEIGVGTRRDPTRALQFYRKAAAQSNVPAMYKLGVILIKGLLGVSAAPREGITWLKRGADNATPECPHSLHELALCHEASDIPGIIPDEAYAVELYTNAAKLGYVPSQVRLGQAYEYGTLGCEVIPRKSIGWYTRAAEKGDPDAELALSGWYLTGAEPFLPQNDVEAYLWARRAADRRLAKAEYAVGYYYECGIGVARPDVEEAQKWYNRAALQENRRAIARLKELKLMGINNAPMNSAQRPRRGKGGTMF